MTYGPDFQYTSQKKSCDEAIKTCTGICAFCMACEKVKKK